MIDCPRTNPERDCINWLPHTIDQCNNFMILPLLENGKLKKSPPDSMIHALIIAKLVFERAVFRALEDGHKYREMSESAQRIYNGGARDEVSKEIQYFALQWQAWEDLTRGETVKCPDCGKVNLADAAHYESIDPGHEYVCYNCKFFVRRSDFE